jgi:hypothetical protein
MGVAMNTPPPPYLEPNLNKVQTYNLHAPPVPSCPCMVFSSINTVYLYHSNDVPKSHNRRQIACPINNTDSRLHLQTSCNTKTANRWHVMSTGVSVISTAVVIHGSHKYSPVVTPHTEQQMFERNEQPGSAQQPGRAGSTARKNRSNNNTYISVPVEGHIQNIPDCFFLL